MRLFACFLLLLLGNICAGAAVLTEDAAIDGQYLHLEMRPNEGATIHTFTLLGTGNDFAGEGGLLQEGFGVASHYLPNRRLNEKLEALEEFTERPVLRFTYDCQGPNIQGLHVVRIMELMPNEASVKVVWRVENRGKEGQWVAPWVRNELTPGGAVDEQDRWDLPTFQGIIQPNSTKWHPASRNWYAATDPARQETLYCVFHADQTHSFLVLWDEEGPNRRAIQTAFVPFMLEPGGAWETTYRLNLVRGLQHVDFASDELAVQLDYGPATLTALLSPPSTLPGLEIVARVMAKNGRVWRLPSKKFDLSPTQLARCGYEWTAPDPGRFDFLAQIQRDGKALQLGAETGSPHGGVDTQFAAGRAPNAVMEPWTDASHALDKGPRTLDRTLLAQGDLLVWAEPSMEKIFRSDTVKTNAPVDPTIRLAAARNEYESFQVVVRPQTGTKSLKVQFQTHDLVNASAGASIPAREIQAFREDYLPITIPSHFEGPTGYWPDALPPLQPFTADGDITYPVWFTVHVGNNAAPGIYRGPLELVREGQPPLAFTLELQVFDFALPATPALKTDFGFWMEAALAGAKMRKGNPTPASLADAYLANAFAHRVTLRDLVRFPEPAGDYAAALAAYGPKLKSYLERGATTIAVPGELMANPAQIKSANDFVRRLKLQHRAFVPLANEPPEPAYAPLQQAVDQWKSLAPDIPVMVASLGVKPFVPPSVDLWALHSPVFDTGNNVEILNHIASGREVWWYVSNTPPRPYGNFFVDFAGIEHRILFWQAFALGVRGMYYWNVDYFEPGQDPWRSLLDATPVNGDGFLVYPGPSGPINSIRWEIIRDGIEDYDYLTLLLQRRDALLAKGGNEALLAQAATVYSLNELVPTLVGFPRDPRVLLRKRNDIARMIEQIDAALAK